MVMQYIPVIPPEPSVSSFWRPFCVFWLKRFIPSWSSVTNPFKRLLEIKAWRILQRKACRKRSIHCLITAVNQNAVKAEGGRALKSLSDVLKKGGQGRFARTSLVNVWLPRPFGDHWYPGIKMHECGFTKRYGSRIVQFISSVKLIERGIVKTSKECP